MQLLRCRQRPTDGRRDLGESLIEIVMTVLVISASVTALVAALASASASAKAQRDNVVADAAIRNVVETVKQDVLKYCSPYDATVVLPKTSTTMPTGFTVAITPASFNCPTVSTTAMVTVKVTSPVGVVDTLTIKVRTP